MMKEDLWKSFLRKLAGWHLATSLRINFFTGKFSVILSKLTPSNGYFSVLYKMLENHLWNSFLLYCKFEKILELVHEISSFPEMLLKELFWKTFQNLPINTRSSRPEVFCQKIFLKILQNSQKNIFARVLTVRSSHCRCSVKKGVLNFANFIKKHLCWSLFAIKLQF